MLTSLTFMISLVSISIRENKGNISAFSVFHLCHFFFGCCIKHGFAFGHLGTNDKMIDSSGAWNLAGKLSLCA